MANQHNKARHIVATRHAQRRRNIELKGRVGHAECLGPRHPRQAHCGDGGGGGRGPERVAFFTSTNRNLCCQVLSNRHPVVGAHLVKGRIHGAPVLGTGRTVATTAHRNKHSALLSWDTSTIYSAPNNTCSTDVRTGKPSLMWTAPGRTQTGCPPCGQAACSEGWSQIPKGGAHREGEQRTRGHTRCSSSLGVRGHTRGTGPVSHLLPQPRGRNCRRGAPMGLGNAYNHRVLQCQR
jgi:hypothetical protein